MKSKKSNLICVLLAIIVLLTGMCSQAKRTDSCLAYFHQMDTADSIAKTENESLYIGNCTGKLITGLRSSIQRLQRVQGRNGVKNYAEFLWIKVILHMSAVFYVITVLGSRFTQNSETTILNYIHAQDGEK